MFNLLALPPDVIFAPGVAAGVVRSQRGAFMSMDSQKMPVGQGSGFIWDKKGHIVTNWCAHCETCAVRKACAVVGMSPSHRKTGKCATVSEYMEACCLSSAPQ